MKFSSTYVVAMGGLQDVLHSIKLCFCESILSRAFPLPPPVSTLRISRPLKRVEITRMASDEHENIGIPKSTYQIILAIVSP